MEPFIRNRDKYAYNVRKVNQYDLQGNFIKTWKSMSEINRVLGIETASICKCCKGKQKSCKFFKWEYF